MGVLFLVYEGLVHWGFFDYLHARAERGMELYQQLRETLAESSESVGEFLTTVESVYTGLSSIIEPRRAAAYLSSLFFL